MNRFLVMALVVTFAACQDATTTADDLPHPRDMGLPEAGFVRPDPENHQIRLPNGMTAYVVEDDQVPLVTISAVVAAGTLEGPVAGSAEALAAAWRAGGTTARSRAAVAAAFERMVAEFTVVQSAEETVLTLNVPREDFREAVALFGELLRRPAVTNQDLANASRAASSSNTRYNGSLDEAVAAFHTHLFDGHPKGRASAGTRPSRGSTLAYHRSFVTPGSVTLAVGGDVPSADAQTALVAAFADWGAAAAVERPPTPPIQSDARRDVLLYPADKLQGWIVMGHELPVVPVNDQAALEVMNYILGGGHFDTRLFRAARDRRGLTNDNSGFLQPGVRSPGSYTFRTYGRPEVVPLLVHLTFEEIDRIRTTPVNPEELRVAQGALADGEFTLGYRDGATTALTLATEWSRYGNHDRSGTYQERIRSVTTADVLAAAQLYLLPERIDVVIVGPMEDILNAQPIEAELPIRALGATGGPGAGM